MPFVAVDAKALEWLGIVWFSQDETGIYEITNKIDQHSLNQKEFALGEGDEGRLIAKKFVFRLIYGGTAYSYSVDADFTHVSRDARFWQEVIDKFYNKYSGISKTHKEWVHQGTTQGHLVMPTGRVYEFRPDVRGNWPITTILNYPVQGLGHDLMTIARVLIHKELFRTLNPDDFKMVSTVHDSVYVDCRSNVVPQVADTIKRCFDRVPVTFSKLFKVNFNLPFRGDIKVGPNMLDMSPI